MDDSYRGRQLPTELAKVVVKLKHHYDCERKLCRSVPTKNPANRTAASLGIGIATVKRIMSKLSKGKLILDKPKRPGRPSGICSELQSIVRQFIRGKNLCGEQVSLAHVKDHLSENHGEQIPKTTLWRTLSRWGFTYGEGRRRDSLKEQDYVIRARRSYLRQKMSNRKNNGVLIRPEVYIDETYINKNHSRRHTWYSDEDGPWVNKPSGVGPRLIIVNAVTKYGWVKGAELIFEAKKRTGDYHGQMNWDNFSVWFTKQLLPNIPANSLIILDNARYHNVYVNGHNPSSQSSKEELRNWLTRNGYPWGNDMLKPELLELCKHSAPMPEYRLDLLARQHGHEILRTPPYHPELQPIEICWAVVKNYMADNCDFTMRGLRTKLPEAFAKVNENTCDAIMKDVFKQEEKYWREDEKLDDEYSNPSDGTLPDDWDDQLGVELTEGV